VKAQDLPPSEDRSVQRRVWPLFVGGVALVLALLGTIVVTRLRREPSVPPSPHVASELGAVPIPNEPWDTIVREEEDWLRLPEDQLLVEAFRPNRADEDLLVDRATLVASLSGPRARGLTGVAPAFDGTELVDGCVPPADCPELAFVRATEHAEVVALSRRADGDRAGAVRLLSATIEAAMGLARSGRGAMSQVVGTAMLARAVTVAFIIDNIDRAEGQPLDVGLATTLTEVHSLKVDLGRGWIGESLRVEPALRGIWDGAEMRTRFLFDERAAAQGIYDTYDGCVAFARGQAPGPPPMANIPGVVDEDWRIAPLDALRIIDRIPLECGPTLDVARTNLQVAQRRAAQILKR
jgi:hypothetical protein